MVYNIIKARNGYLVLRSKNPSLELGAMAYGAKWGDQEDRNMDVIVSPTIEGVFDEIRLDFEGSGKEVRRASKEG